MYISSKTTFKTTGPGNQTKNNNYICKIVTEPLRHSGRQASVTTTLKAQPAIISQSMAQCVCVYGWPYGCVSALVFLASCHCVRLYATSTGVCMGIGGWLWALGAA